MLHVYLKQIDVLIKNFNNDCPERRINSQTLGYGDAPNGDFLLPGTDTARHCTTDKSLIGGGCSALYWHYGYSAIQLLL